MSDVNFDLFYSRVWAAIFAVKTKIINHSFGTGLTSQLITRVDKIRKELVELKLLVDNLNIDTAASFSPRINESVQDVLNLDRSISDLDYFKNNQLKLKATAMVSDAYSLRFAIIDKCYAEPSEELKAIDDNLIQTAASYGMRNYQQYSS